MTRRVWLEVALNGAWSRARQPLMPVTAEQVAAEAVACARAGAAVIHFHAYDEKGQPCEDVEFYARAIEAIRSQCDAIVYPTIGFTPDDPESPRRYAPLRELARRGLLEWIPIDPGSINVNRYDAVAQRQPGRFYLNSDSHIRRGLEFCAGAGLVPTFAIYEPGFVRLGAALTASTPGSRVPLYRFMFTAGRAWGFPAEEYALTAYRALLQGEAADAPWMIAGHEVDLRHLIPATVAAGGHVRVGLEDAPYGTTLRNIDWVESAVAVIEKSGGALATASEIRQVV
jgi:uncharacterized protein (DUF849 family)